MWIEQTGPCCVIDFIGPVDLFILSIFKVLETGFYHTGPFYMKIFTGQISKIIFSTI